MTIPIRFVIICSLLFVSIQSLALYHNSDAKFVDNNNENRQRRICARKRNGTVTHERCDSENCFTFWKEDGNGTVTVIQQGCWVSSGNTHECERTQCISVRPPSRALNNTKYCCCTGDLCNLNFTDGYTPSNEPDEQQIKDASVRSFERRPINLLVIILIVGSIIVVIFTIVTLIWRLWQKQPKKEDVELADAPSPPSDFLLSKLKLYNIIGQGRYGAVWKGQTDEQDVAVKIFPAHHRNYFLNERDLYNEAGEHHSLVRYFCSGERQIAPGAPVDYMLVLGLEQECLQEYLKKNVVDLATLSKMALGIASGLAHLHSDLGKPCIAHRDLNTRNILVRSNLTCCICDLGLAVVPRRTENRALSEAGTLRYMAPEVLEGAVNLRDCESALKQIDVYALGLVLWELGSRCVDMQVSEPASYAPPYYKEVGDHPTLEQMQCLVSRHKARPMWPTSWKDTAAARLFSETAEDCWDQDAEARLTALCVEERLLELPTLRGRVLYPMHAPASPTPLINNNHLHDHINIDASVGTVETLLSLSEENCKNSNQLAVCITPLHPYQGRNPCMERNLLSTSSESLWIDKSFKDCINVESQSLMTRDHSNYVNHRATPIAYVQNAVHAVDSDEISTSSSKKTFKWSGLKKLFTNKKESNIKQQRDTQVRIVPGKLINSFVTSAVSNDKRPSTLPLLASPQTEEFATKSGISHLMKSDSIRQRSLEQFAEVFCSTNDLTRLKDPSQRVKTPGDVPPSVRRTRGKAAKESAARFSLYDDRMMTQWGSAPDLKPIQVVSTPKPQQLTDLQDSGSVSSF